ncbi:Serine/threonine-protein kinase ssp1 [Diplonema papillatum]|nr:Serine/threonine-protein kinase ssp1 [Diplonema papillatum]
MRVEVQTRVPPLQRCDIMRAPFGMHSPEGLAAVKAAAPLSGMPCMASPKGECRTTPTLRTYASADSFNDTLTTANSLTPYDSVMNTPMSEAGISINSIAGVQTSPRGSMPFVSHRDIPTTNTFEKSFDDWDNKSYNQYTIISEVGRGSFSKVKLAYDNNTDLATAIKVMDRAHATKTAEIEILRRMDHPNVVSLFEVIDDPAVDKVYMALEFVSEGPLGMIQCDGTLSIGATPDARIREILRDVAAGLEHVHAAGVVHRDLKPENLLVDRDGLVKLSDFNVSSQDPLSSSRSHGTIAFNPPEAGWCEDRKRMVDPYAVDLWALGVTLYTLRYGRLPFHANCYKGLMQLIGHSTPAFPALPGAEADLDALLPELLEKNPVLRATLPRVARCRFLKRGGDHGKPAALVAKRG